MPRTTRNERRIAATCRGTHPICVASDSGLPECACWCAECKEGGRRLAERWATDGPIFRVLHACDTREVKE